MDEEELQGQFAFLETKVDRALRSISAMNSSLATGSTWQRIHGAILVPESVDTGVIAPLAITETKIDSDSVSTPKLQANAVTANKLEANLVLATNIIGGTYVAPNIFGVVLGTAGLKMFDGGGVQRGWLKTDGSGWLAASDKFYWDASGNLTAAGITVASAASGARTELSVNGLRVYNSSNQVIVAANSTDGFRTYSSTGATNYNRLAMDGSGFLGSSDGTSANAALSWNGAGVGVLNASKITAGTLNCSSLTVTNFSASSINTGSVTFASGGTMNGATVSGTFGNTGGTMNLGKLTVAGQLTIGAGGSIVDADGSTWDQTGLVLKSTGSFGDSLKWMNGASTTGSIYSDSTVGIFMTGGTGAASDFMVRVNTSQFDLGGGSSGGYHVRGGSTYGGVRIDVGSVTGQLLCDSANVYTTLGDTTGTYQFGAKDSAGTLKFGVASNGAVKIYANATNGIATGYTTLGSLTGRWAIFNNAGSLVGYIPVYTNIT